MSTEEIMAKERWATEEAFFKGNVDALEAVFTQDAIFTIYPFPTLQGLKAFKQLAATMSQGFSDIQWKWDEVIIKGNTAVQRYTMTAKHTGKSMLISVEPMGKEVTLRGCAVYHLKNGKIFEFIEYSDYLGFMQQLGAIPSQY